MSTEQAVCGWTVVVCCVTGSLQREITVFFVLVFILGVNDHFYSLLLSRWNIYNLLPNILGIVYALFPFPEECKDYEVWGLVTSAEHPHQDSTPACPNLRLPSYVRKYNIFYFLSAKQGQDFQYLHRICGSIANTQ